MASYLYLILFILFILFILEKKELKTPGMYMDEKFPL
jgi:hypothetical protein